MKKKLLTTILVLSLVTLGLAGCQTEDTPTDTPTSVQDESTDTGANTDITTPETSLQICGGCEVEKECGKYEVNGQNYIICNDCYNEFATAFDLKKD